MVKKKDGCIGFVLNSERWQIPVALEDVHKKVFVTPAREYEVLRMPFSMMNSGATLIRVLKKVLEGLSRVAVYINDIVIYSDSWEVHFRMLKELFGVNVLFS